MTPRQERLRQLIKENKNRRWREARIRDGKNPNASLLELLAESFLEYLPNLTKVLGSPSRIRRFK